MEIHYKPHEIRMSISIMLFNYCKHSKEIFCFIEYERRILFELNNCNENFIKVLQSLEEEFFLNDDHTIGVTIE